MIARHAAAGLLLFAVALPAVAFTVDANWDMGGLQICTSASQVQFHVHAVPVRMSYACLAPAAPLRTCFFQKTPGLNPHLRLLTIKCTVTPVPLPDPARIHISSFEHRERAGF